jgi:uncharacterized protein YbaR (Trm112 family)
MRDSALELIEEAEIDLEEGNLISKVKNELSDVRDEIEKAKKNNRAKEIAKKQVEETRLQRILTFLEDIQSLINK